MGNLDSRCQSFISNNYNAFSLSLIFTKNYSRILLIQKNIFVYHVVLHIFIMDASLGFIRLDLLLLQKRRGLKDIFFRTYFSILNFQITISRLHVVIFSHLTFMLEFSWCTSNHHFFNETFKTLPNFML